MASSACTYALDPRFSEHAVCYFDSHRTMSNPLVSGAIGLIQSAASALRVAAELLFYSAVWLCGLALLVKGKEAIMESIRDFLGKGK